MLQFVFCTGFLNALLFYPSKVINVDLLFVESFLGKKMRETNQSPHGSDVL
jgi:hypothetical protein